MPNMQKTLLQLTTLVYIKSSAIYKEYLTGTRNENNKYVSKLTALKFGCVLKKSMLRFRLHVLPDFPKLELLTFAR